MGQDFDKEKYEFALQLLFYEGQIAWQINVLFIGLNVGIGTIVVNYIKEINEERPILIIMSIVGIIINIMWLGTFLRNSKYYNFRMAQAREAEHPDWNLLKGEGYKFSKGEEIPKKGDELNLEDRRHKLSKFEQFGSNKRAISISISLFIIIFSMLLLLSTVPLLCVCGK
jgi:hypothetical protein